jgi:hypothetical protein
MKDKPKRRWFRFHLQTAVVMMIVSGGMLWLNISRSHDIKGGEESYRCGWPMTWYWTCLITDNVPPEYGGFTEGKGLLVDVAIVLCVVSAVAVISELLLRRLEARKT